MDNKNAFSKILILVIIAVLIIGGFFVWQNRGKEWFVKKEKPKLPEGIEIIEQGDKKIVRNKVEGYEVTVPKEWAPQRPNIQNQSGLNLLTPKEYPCNYSLSKIPNPEKIPAKIWFENVYADLVDVAELKEIKVFQYSGIEVTQNQPHSGKSIYLNIEDYIYNFSYYPLNEVCEARFKEIIESFKTFK
jgi:hypothetical protein